MHMLQVLFFAEAYYQFRLFAQHVPGISNTLADHLSRNKLNKFFNEFPTANTKSSYVPLSLLQWLLDTQMDWTSERYPALHHFSEQGIAQTTNKTYKSALHKFACFCSTYNVLTPFPVSKSLLCHFATYLACQQLAPQTIKVYMAAIRYMQITLGLPEPCEYTSMPRLRLVQSGIQRDYAAKEQRKYGYQ